MAEIRVALVNASTVLSDDEVRAALPALQTQVHRDFAPAWGIDADLAFAPHGSKPPAGAWWLTILDDSDQAGALGYHDLTTQGLPLAKIFAKTDRSAGLAWTVTASHELLEMLADPDIDLTVFVQQTSTSGVLYAYENCDACEADTYGYRIDGVLVSDFVHPAWFQSFRKPGSVQLDHGKHVSKPFELLPGGYIGVFDVKAGTGWQQLTADGHAGASRVEPNPGSRRERRRLPRDEWRESTV